MSTRARVLRGLGATLLVGGALFATTPAAYAGPKAMSRKDTTPPTAPTNLHVVSATDVDIVLAWNASTDNKGVVIYEVFFDDNESPLFIGSDQTQLDVHFNRAVGLVPGSTHTFQVRAEDPSGNFSLSNIATGTFLPGDNTPPTAPSNLRVVSNTESGVELAWDPSTDESSIDTYFVDGWPCSPHAVPGSTTRVLAPSITADPVCGMSPGFTYTFAVRARDAFDNDSAFSNSVSVFFGG